MADPSLYTFPSPLAGWETQPALSEEKNEDGKSLKNTETGVLSEAYETFTPPLCNGRRGAL